MITKLPLKLWTRTTRLFIDFPVTPTMPDGSPADINGVQCALLPYRSRGPEADTVWKDAIWTPRVDGATGVATILVAGPDAPDPGTSGLQLGPYGGDLWGRVMDHPVKAVSIVARIDLMTD